MHTVYPDTLNGLYGTNKIPKGLQTLRERCRIRLYMLCTLSALTWGAADPDVHGGRRRTRQLGATSGGAALLTFLISPPHFPNLQIQKRLRLFKPDVMAAALRVVNNRQLAGKEFKMFRILNVSLKMQLSSHRSFQSHITAKIRTLHLLHNDFLSKLLRNSPPHESLMHR